MSIYAVRSCKCLITYAVHIWNKWQCILAVAHGHCPPYSHIRVLFFTDVYIWFSLFADVLCLLCLVMSYIELYDGLIYCNKSQRCSYNFNWYQVSISRYNHRLHSCIHCHSLLLPGVCHSRKTQASLLCYLCPCVQIWSLHIPSP